MKRIAALWAWIKWRLIVVASSFAKFSAAKADPVMITMLAVMGAVASPSSAVLDSVELLFWLLIGSMCGVLFVLFGDEKTALTWQSVRGKLAKCFLPGFCLTGLAIKAFNATPSAEIVLGAALILSVSGPVMVPMLAKLLAKAVAKLAGEKPDGGGA